jgi:hypothetical protein
MMGEIEQQLMERPVSYVFRHSNVRVSHNFAVVSTDAVIKYNYHADLENKNKKPILINILLVLESRISNHESI